LTGELDQDIGGKTRPIGNGCLWGPRIPVKGTVPKDTIPEQRGGAVVRGICAETNAGGGIDEKDSQGRQIVGKLHNADMAEQRQRKWVEQQQYDLIRKAP